MRRRLAAGAAAILTIVAGCTTETPADPSPASAPTVESTAGPTDDATAGPTAGATTGPTRAATRTPSAAAPEPTTTNTLPPPAARTPEPSTAGVLTARSLPVPRGWRTVVREGGPEEGYLGNGTWTHGRDPRYAARDTITVGCAPVTRDDYPDPDVALEGTYEDAAGAPGVALAMQFASPQTAAAYWSGYLGQLAACTDPAGPVLITVVDAGDSLINHRAYPDGEWTEVGLLAGPRVTLMIMSDAQLRIGRTEAAEIVADLRASSSR